VVKEISADIIIITENGVPSEKVGTVAREASINLCVSTTYENI